MRAIACNEYGWCSDLGEVSEGFRRRPLGVPLHDWTATHQITDDSALPSIERPSAVLRFSGYVNGIAVFTPDGEYPPEAVCAFARALSPLDVSYHQSSHYSTWDVSWLGRHVLKFEVSRYAYAKASHQEVRNEVSHEISRRLAQAGLGEISRAVGRAMGLCEP